MKFKKRILSEEIGLKKTNKNNSELLLVELIKLHPDPDELTRLKYLQALLPKIKDIDHKFRNKMYNYQKEHSRNRPISINFQNNDHKQIIDETSKSLSPVAANGIQRQSTMFVQGASSRRPFDVVLHRHPLDKNKEIS